MLLSLSDDELSHILVRVKDEKGKYQRFMRVMHLCANICKHMRNLAMRMKNNTVDSIKLYRLACYIKVQPSPRIRTLKNSYVERGEVIPYFVGFFPGDKPATILDLSGDIWHMILKRTGEWKNNFKFRAISKDMKKMEDEARHCRKAEFCEWLHTVNLKCRRIGCNAVNQLYVKKSAVEALGGVQANYHYRTLCEVCDYQDTWYCSRRWIQPVHTLSREDDYGIRARCIF